MATNTNSTPIYSTASFVIVDDIVRLKKGKTAIWYERVQQEIPRWWMFYWGEVKLPSDPNKVRVRRTADGCSFKFKSHDKWGNLIEIEVEFRWEGGVISASGRKTYLKEFNDWGDPITFYNDLIPILD